MLCFSALLFGLLLTGSQCGQHLPSWFKLGAASSAFQIEGGWNVSDKGESVWDKQLREHPETADGNIEVACDSYHKWQRDIEMCGQLGLDVYRFSISWPRILPNGLTNYISVDGIKYYNDLIDGLIANGIEPVVTLYHFDLPQRLQDLGGWANPLIADWFAEYCRVAFTNFGDRVKIWLTINEPLAVCDIGYSNNSVPYLNDSRYGAYLCNKNVLLAHAKAYRIYEKEFKSVYNGKLSIVSLVMWLKPKNKDDEEITALAREFMGSRFEYPIYSKEGGWPKKIDAFLTEQNIKEGYSTPRLIPFTEEEIELIKGDEDFVNSNNYSEIIHNLRETLLTVTHTNVILWVPTYKYSYYRKIYNWRIETFNNLLFHDIKLYNYAILFDSNFYLSCDYSMFLKYNDRLKNNGMLNIFNNSIKVTLTGSTCSSSGNEQFNTDIENSVKHFFRGQY